MVKFDLELLKKDIKNMYLPLICIVVYIIAGNLFAGKICPLRMICGLPCPGCGITRAFLLVLQGKFYEATMMHPFWIAVVLIVVLYLAFRYLGGNLRQSKKIVRALRICLIAILILCIAYYIYRMIYWFPNREPMVYDENNMIYMFKNIFR